MQYRPTREFYRRAEQLSRDELWELLEEQEQGKELDKNLYEQAQRIEWVFANKMSHITDTKGNPITERPLTNKELALLLDAPFMEDKILTEAGISVEQQRQIYLADDIVLWARHMLGAFPRAYQVLVLRDPALRKVLRMGRRSGKSFSLALIVLHYGYTTPNGRCLVMAPTKDQAGLIYKECMDLVDQGDLSEIIVRNVTSPQFDIEMSTGSTIRFFSTGMKSNTKSDTVRGQEAHIIVLDEMDYMGSEDLDALYAMLQKTDANQPDKQLIGASTPSGQKQRFYEWCTSPTSRFKEFYFPSFVNPHWTKEAEEEFKEIYSEMGYRHEIEADWGEDEEGVYPHKFINAARKFDWAYSDTQVNKGSSYILGVDWDKYGAGPNLCALEYVSPNHPNKDFAGRIRIAFREEIPRSDFVLTEAVGRILELDRRFDFEHMYIDRGFGEAQLELLQQHGLKHPERNIRRRLKGISFASRVEVRDPATKEIIKKEIKPFMVENLRFLLEREKILIPESDDTLYKQLIAYVVDRFTQSGRPVFKASGNQLDHAHDALILACYAFTENYDDLMKLQYATRSRSFSSDAFGPIESVKKQPSDSSSEDQGGSEKYIKRAGIPRSRSRTSSIKRRMF